MHMTDVWGALRCFSEAFPSMYRLTCYHCDGVSGLDRCEGRNAPRACPICFIMSYKSLAFLPCRGSPGSVGRLLKNSKLFLLSTESLADDRVLFCQQ